ncbi:MAG: BACON domain-containing protein [Bryobacteraceae bacterium]
MKARLLFLALAVSVQSQQIITTYAGTEWVFPAAAHPALTSPLSSVLNTVVDNQGRLIIADGLNHVVARVNANGELAVIAGNGLPGFSGDGGDALQASLNGPVGVVFDAAGNLYIADAGNYRVRRVTPAGVISTVAGNGSGTHRGDGGAATSAGLYPLAIAVDSSNAILIADSTNFRVRKVDADGTISTIAGVGTREFSGEGRQAREASLTPTAIHVDREGRILIADTENYRVYRIGTDGILRTLAGSGQSGLSGDGGPAIAATTKAIFALTTDAEGNVLLADTNNYRIRRITPAGIISTIAGGGTKPVTTAPVSALTADIGFPNSVAVDPLGRIYIADVESQIILLLSADGSVVSRIAGNGQFKSVKPGTPAPLVNMTEPSGVAIGADGSVYYVELQGHRVAKIDPRGGVTVIAGNGVGSCCADSGPAIDGLVSNPNSLAFAPDGALIVVDGGSQKIRRIFQGTITSIAGTAFTTGSSGDGGPATQALLHNPWGIAIDPAGNIFFINRGNHSVRRIDTKGVITTVAGNGRAGFSGDGGPATAASLNFPFALAMHANGDLLIADYLNNRIRAVSPAGIIRTWAGNGNFAYDGDGGPAARAGLDGPYALAVDSRGNVYTSHDNSVIRRINAEGIISTVAGLFSYNGFSGDGGAAPSAALNYPYSLAVDPAGSLYVADSSNNRIRVIRNLSLTTTVSPSSISLNAAAGSAGGLSAQLTVASSVNGVPFTSPVTYGQTAGNWLTVATSNTNAPATLTLTANASALAPGRYTATINVVTNPAGSSNPVSVVLTVEEVAAKLTLSAQSLSFSRNEGTAADVKTFEIRNAGGGVLSYQITAAASDSRQWLKVAPANGSVRAGQVAEVNVTADPAGLKPGTYLGSVIVTATAARTVVPVTLSVRASRPTILVSQSGLTFTAVAGGGSPLPQKVGILNIGAGTLAWTAAPAKGNFVRLGGTARGVVNVPWLDVGDLSVGVAPAGYPPGQYYDQIFITGAADNTPQVITVLMNVLPAGTNPGPEVSPSGMLFVTKAGENPGSQTVTYNHLGADAVTFNSSRLGTWYDTAPSNGRATANTPGSMIIQPALKSLTPGVYQGVVTIQEDVSRIVRFVTVLAVIAPPESGARDSRNAASCPGLGLRVEATALSDRFSVRVGEAVTVEVKAADECGNLLIPPAADVRAAEVTAAPKNGDPQINLTHLGNGVWQGTWRPVQPAANTDITVLAKYKVAGGAARSQLGAVVLRGSVQPQGATGAPLLTAAGVVHSASQESGVPIAPGSLITLYGTKLADATLNGTEVRLGDQILPPLFISEGQLNAQVPYNVTVDTQHQIWVKRGDAIGVVETVTVSVAQPGIFTKSLRGTGQGAIVKQDGVTLAEPGTPARRGEVVVIYCSGLGPVTPAVKEGLPAPSSPLSGVVNPVTVTIGGQQAQVNFAGLAPGFSGLYQINAVVPAGAPTGDAVDVVIEVAAQRSRAVTIAVQ